MKQLNALLILFILGLSTIVKATGNDSIVETDSAPWKKDLIRVKHFNDSLPVTYIENTDVYKERWDRLAHPVFWKTLMTLSPDSCVINIAKTREIVDRMTMKEWDAFSDDDKKVLRDSIRAAHGLSEDDRIFMTSGKRDFYAFDLVLPTVSKGIEVFQERGVDPWYAQSILLIESPGKLARSNVGAYGSFQLMASVARKYGLTVNRSIDERKDFDKSAVAASRLIKETCIPEAKNILNRYNLNVDENDLWFRLFVLHVYHAGAYNVSKVVDKINPEDGSMDLIRQMWTTEAGRFRNASQNYTQLALAAILIFEDMLWESCDYVVINEHTSRKSDNF